MGASSLTDDFFATEFPSLFPAPAFSLPQLTAVCDSILTDCEDVRRHDAQRLALVLRDRLVCVVVLHLKVRIDGDQNVGNVRLKCTYGYEY